jgi:drug/metabolite transporter (DMT)-like permease
MLAASVLLATCLRFWLQTHAQQQLSASQAALLLTLEPVWTAALGLTLLGEHLSRLQLSGCGLIFLALVLSRLWPVPRT